MPQGLTKEAQKEWRRIIPQLLAMGVLTVVDGPLLAIWCEAVADVGRANRVLETEGMTFRNTESGVIKAHPAIAIRDRAQAKMQRLAPEFGLTPAARTRLHVESKPPTESKFKQLKARRNHSVECNPGSSIPPSSMPTTSYPDGSSPGTTSSSLASDTNETSSTDTDGDSGTTLNQPSTS